MRTEDSHRNQQTAGARDRRRQAVCLVVTFAGTALGLLSLRSTDPALIWNPSVSVPVGLYSLAQRPAVRGDIVAIAPGPGLRNLLDAHDVLPAGKLLLKHLAAAGGDRVCRNGPSITIDGELAAIARDQTGSGHPLPVWAGCRVLLPDEILALAPHPLSFDSRYFGPIASDQVVGVALPVLTLPSSAERG